MQIIAPARPDIKPSPSTATAEVVPFIRPTSSSVSVAFTVIEAGIGRASPSKTFGLDENGEPRVTAHGGQPAAGVARRRSATGTPAQVLADLAEVLDGLSEREALVCAPPPPGNDAWPFTTRKEAEGRVDVIARSREYFTAPAGPSLLGLDFDIKAWPPELKARVGAFPEQLSGIIDSVAQVFSSAAFVRRASSSEGVRNRETGATTSPNAGQHRFFICRDGRDVERAVRALHHRLILAGWAYGQTFETGYIEIRSLIDATASATPERLWFEGRTQLADPVLEHVPDARKSILLNVAGGALDTSLIADLTQADLDEVDTISQGIMAELQPEAARLRAVWKEKRKTALVAGGIDADRAAKIAGLAVEHRDLVDDFLITFDDGTAATVSKIMADQMAFHGKTCPDPLEPEYGGGRNKAILYADCNPVRIESQAHGGISYTLRELERWYEPVEAEAANPKSAQLQQLPQSSVADPASPPVRTSRSSWIDPREWEGQPVKPREWIVDDWIPKDEVTLLYGDGGVGKTLLAQQLGTTAAAGLSWLGKKTRPCRVMLFLCEDGPDELHRRQRDIAKAYGISLAELGNLRLTSRQNEDNLLATWDRSGAMKLTSVWHTLRDDAIAFRADVVIIDTLADTFGGSEIDRLQVNSFGKGCLGRLGKEIGGTVIALGHPSRAGRDTGEGSSGSTAWNNAVRSRLYLEHMKNDPTMSVRILSNKKLNYGARGAQIKLRWARGAFEPIGISRPAGGAVVAGEIPGTAEDACDFGVISALLGNADARLTMAKNSPYFAPKVLKKLAAEDLAAFSQDEVEASILRLQRSGTIREDNVGRDASSRKVPGFIVIPDKLSGASVVSPASSSAFD